MINNSTLNTYVQSWNRGLLCLFSFTLVLLHALAFVLAMVYAPQMFYQSELLGAICQDKTDRTNTWYEEEQSSHAGCTPVVMFEELSSLEDLSFSFRFPSEETKQNYYSVWNWRLLGNLYFEISLKNDNNFEKLVQKVNETDQVEAMKMSFSVTMHSRLDVAPMNEITIEDDPDPSLNFTASNSSFVDDNGSYVFNWRRQAELVEHRDLQCIAKVIQDEMLNDEQRVSYVCTMNPLFDIQLVNNESFIVTLQFSKPAETRNETNSLNKTLIFEEENDFLTSPVVVNELSLILITENSDFHRGIFYIKCLCTPFVIVSLLLFCVRMYLNDLYISIPDRLLMCVALAQIIQNIPVELLLSSFSESRNIVYLKVLDETGQLFLLISMILFWVIYTKDKLAKNEPWERNTRYYWRQITLVSLGALVALFFIAYSQFPVLKNPFSNHWQPGTSAVYVSLGLLFGLATLGLVAHTYVSVLIFRVLCDVSVVVIYQGSSLRGGLWRLKLVLLYCFSVSSLTIGGYILSLAVHLSLHWNPQFYINPIPFHLTFASAFFIGNQAMWNIHTIALLIMLARGPGSLNDYIKPLRYIDTGSVDQYELEVLHEHTVPAPLAIRRRNQIHRRPSSEDFLEVLDAKRNGIVRSTEHYDASSSRFDGTDDFGSQDPGQSDSSFSTNPRDVESPDMLESLRRETVHLWENSGNRSEPILERVTEDEYDDQDELQVDRHEEDEDGGLCYGQHRPPHLSGNGVTVARYER